MLQLVIIKTLLGKYSHVLRCPKLLLSLIFQTDPFQCRCPGQPQIASFNHVSDFEVFGVLCRNKISLSDDSPKLMNVYFQQCRVFIIKFKLIYCLGNRLKVKFCQVFGSLDCVARFYVRKTYHKTETYPVGVLVDPIA